LATLRDLPYYRRAMATDFGVIPALMESLGEARERAGKEYRHVRNFTSTSERMLRRYEGKENYPAGSDLDDLVAAYAAALGAEVSPFDLWDEAIRRARAAKQEPADDSDEARAPRVAQAAREAGAASRKVRERKPRRRRSTGT
jgi:hypothetical protein